MGDEPVQLELLFSITDLNMYGRRESSYCKVSYDTDGLAFKTLDEYERHYYITDQTELHSLWLMVSDLEDTLTMSIRLGEA